ncbi:RcnB family protein [Acidicapsa dinghuensis]|uniref:RcnB family protein n=1 Tax=Acidicapsa dinghuensis TaxID=2218256 RepID=A0ABW1EM44_9BACT|nr:RcnB family protein [Acidicapsa dinghuensis]
MGNFRKAVGLSLLAVTLSTGTSFAFAQDHHDNHQYVRHDEWRKGEHIKKEDWNRGDKIDYRQYHLSPPRRGYEWRLVDGNYVLAAVATGVIVSTVVASTVH